MRAQRSILYGFILALVSIHVVVAQNEQPSGREFRRFALMNGNQVRAVFGNWGVIGQPAEQGKRGAWKNDNNGYIGDVSPLVGAEVKWKGVTFHSVVTPPVARPTRQPDQDPNSGKPWTWEPEDGYFNANQQRVALSNDKATWPTSWPDKINDAVDPGWRSSWNGYFGKRVNADLETYFVMNDNNDERFNSISNNIVGVAFRPDSTRPTRKGLSLQMKVRALQWAQFLAKDNIFWLYEITNTGTTSYDRAVFGMLVGTYVGVTSTEDYQEYADDWSFFDIPNNITYTGDYGRSTNNPLWVGQIGTVGYAFLESPGNPFDGIDNDVDADSTTFGQSAPRFTEASFDSTLIGAGMQLVLIRDDYSRFLYTVPSVPAGDSVLITTRGKSVWVRPGVTKVAEGNVIRNSQGNDIVNPNAYDGIDNDFDGIIDENYYLHYRQIKRTRAVPPVTLFDILRPVRHRNSLISPNVNPLSMIDERRNDGIDNNGDWNILRDDVGRDGIPNTGDFGEGDGLPTSGYDAQGNDTGLPGEPHIDKTDVRESDQIGLTSFYYFTPSNNFSYADDEELWRSLAPGFFDVPDNIVGGKPQSGVDGDFMYGSGYFPLLAKSTERFSLALVYGGGRGGSVEDDITDLLKNKKTVQKIYDANYQFPQPPDLPTLRAVPGDRQITLYWDRRAEETIDPVLNLKDFEGYKVYKSTDPNFSDIFTITDGSGSPQGYRPLAQFDVKNGVRGFFRATGELFDAAAGYAYYLGDDTGIQHTLVDREVDNGRRYYYAIVAYDRGDEIIGIFPSENTKFVSILPSGEVTHDQNVAIVTPNAQTAGYVKAGDGVPLTHVVTYGTGSITFQLVDPTKITGRKYRVEFFDSENDGVDNNGNGLLDDADSTEATRTTAVYSVRDMNDVTEFFVSSDTLIVPLLNKNQISPTVIVRNAQNTVIPSSNYRLETSRGVIRGSTPGSLPPGNYSITYQYYPVYRSPNIKDSPYLGETKDADIFDGVELDFANDWGVVEIDTLSRWFGKDPYRYSFSTLFTQVGSKIFRGIRKPSDYVIQFSNSIADTSYPDPELYPFAHPVNFRVYNATDSAFIKFIFADLDGNGKLSPQDELVFLERGPRGNQFYTWDIKFSPKLGDPPDTTYVLGTGVRLELRLRKPFRRGDIFEFTTAPPKIDETRAAQDLLNVKVVPNPYVTASSFEPPLNPGVTSGRGQRKIDFIHVPANATISIFTARGDQIITLRHEGNIEDGTLSWNLKTKENLDIAYGVYFYVVESPVGNKTGKFAVIK